jgi:putative colanic acid biosynthesis UDP-glucose lipid carrier transferase
MNARFLRLLQFLIAFMDILILNAVFFVAILLFAANFFNQYSGYWYLIFFFSLAWLIIAFTTNIYKSKDIFSFELFTKRSMQGVLYFIILIVIYLFLFNHYIISRTLLLIILVCLPASLLLNRFIFHIVYKYYKRKDYLLDKVVLVGYNNVTKKLVSYFEENSYNKEIIGICDDADKVNEVYHYPILSGISDAFEVCKKYGANEIFSSIAPEQNPEIYSLIQFADQNCIKFRIVPDISLFVKRKVHINYINEMPVLTLRYEPLEDMTNRIKKRLFDIIISLAVIIFILSWLIPIISLLIWLDSKGPVFFAQIRSGKGNLQFNCLKFRSMKVNNIANIKRASRDDQRLTRIGKILRRTSLDEFPQFLNVLKGNMSIVGPRPHMLKDTDEFSRVVNQYMVRHFLKPGITGWAQVNGFRGEVNSIEKLQGRVERDVWYMENWSIMLDLKILFLTFFNVIKGDKNAF